MRVKIVKANSDTYWYANAIGEEFEVDNTLNSDSFDVIDNEKAIKFDKTNDGHASGYCISKDDCEVIEEDIIEKIHTKSKLFICASNEEKNKIIESAENLLLQYSVKKYNDKLWHVEIMF
jgi:hypothetical protein